MDIQLQRALHKALRADPDPTQMKSRLPHKILLVVPWLDCRYLHFWQQTPYFVPTDSQPPPLPSLWVADCFSIIRLEYAELTRLWSGCSHLSVYPCGSAIWLTSDKQQCRIPPKSVFCQVSLFQWCSWAPVAHKKTCIGMSLRVSRTGCTQPRLLVSLSQMLKWTFQLLIL